MELPTYFADFLKEIRPSASEQEGCADGHRVLRERLSKHEDLSKIIVSTFLQGSYRRATAIRAAEGERSDVDVITVTNLSEDEYPDPRTALSLFESFLDKHYKGKWKPKGRSFGITLSYVELDLVVTSAPLEADKSTLSNAAAYAFLAETLESADLFMAHSTRVPEWKLSPLRIPARDEKRWVSTHPLEQIKWTWEKNKLCSAHYVNVVKALKWWRRVTAPTPEYPKSYPLEHVIGFCCPDGIESVAEGLTLTLESIVSQFAPHVQAGSVPELPDHGVPEHNVLRRITPVEFAGFHRQVCKAAEKARSALDSKDAGESAGLWWELFGDKFPKDSSGDGGKGGYTAASSGGAVAGTKFA